MKRSLREATTEELIEALSGRDSIEYIVTDKDERCQIIVENQTKQLYKSTGRYGPETIIRYIQPAGGS